MTSTNTHMIVTLPRQVSRYSPNTVVESRNRGLTKKAYRISIAKERLQKFLFSQKSLILKSSMFSERIVRDSVRNTKTIPTMESPDSNLSGKDISIGLGITRSPFFRVTG